MKWFKVGTLCLATMIAASATAQSNPGELTENLRQSLEEQFRSSTGLGFSSFGCDISSDSPPRGEFTCEATDEEGDQFTYRLISRGEGQPPTVTTTQPVDQLNPAGLAVLGRPCLEFLGAFERSEWPGAYGSLSAELQNAVSLTDLQASLEPIRQALGDIRTIEARTYASPSPGLHLLEFDLATEGGDAVARFRLRFTDDEQSKIMAFLVTSQPGSGLQAVLLENSGRQTLTSLLGQPVRQIEAPLTELKVIGDAVEGTANLADGSEITIRVEQYNTAHDLDSNDYRFQVLDVAWLIRQYLVSIGEAPDDIDCPARTAPDGGQVECSVAMEDGSERLITIARRGGEHRLLQ